MHHRGAPSGKKKVFFSKIKKKTLLFYLLSISQTGGEFVLCIVLDAGKKKLKGEKVRINVNKTSSIWRNLYIYVG